MKKFNFDHIFSYFLSRGLIAASLIGSGITVVLFLLMANRAHAQLSIDITEGQFAPIVTAIPHINTTRSQTNAATVAQEIRATIIADLGNSGLFKILKSSEDKLSVGADIYPDLASWRTIQAQALLETDLVLSGDTVILRYRLWDVFTGAQLLMRRVRADQRGRKRLAHIIADAIYERLTGEKGYFDTQIAFIEESGNARDRVKKLAIMDQDGANLRYLSDGSSLVLTPRFAPDGRQVTYLQFINKKVSVVTTDLLTLETTKLGDYPGLTIAPRFTPDGESILFAFVAGGNSDVYVRNLKNGVNKKLTFHPDIDISPSMSPDGRFIVFSSSRSGSPQLYVMNSDGSGKRRISFGQGSYHTPVWSPRGDLIAYTLHRHNRFSIGVMEPDGSNERILTESWHDEGPSWAPNGRRILFFRSSPYGPSGEKVSRLFSIDISGFDMRPLSTPSEASDPAWSPSLH